MESPSSKQEKYCQFEKKLHNRTHSHITFTFRGRESIKMCIGVNKIAGGSVNANARTFIEKNYYMYNIYKFGHTLKIPWQKFAFDKLYKLEKI